MTWENRLTFEVSSADPDSTTPVWVDLTPRVNDVIQTVDVGIGRQNDLESAEPTVLTLVLENADDALTYGNTASPYFAWWGPGRKCRLRETIAGVVDDLMTGFLQMPTETLVTSGIEQRVTLTVVDRLADLGSSEPFESALGAYILNTADLKGYWPLTDAAQPFYGRGPVTDPAGVYFFGLAAGGPLACSVTPAAGLAPRGGEGGAARFLTGSSGGQVTFYAQLSLPSALHPSVVPTDGVTVVAWAAVTGTTYVLQDIVDFALLGVGGSIGHATTLSLTRDVTSGVWTLTAAGDMTGSVTAGAVGSATLFPIGIRIVQSSATLELWIGGQRFTTTLAGSAMATSQLSAPYFGGLPIDYDLSHAQAYVGPTYSYSDFLAQIAMGYAPLERQSTGDRIRTIAQYAGIPAAELTQIDAGSSVMQAASLAGKTPLQAMRDAERTEQGLLYVDGSGNLVFKDRRTLYNI